MANPEILQGELARLLADALVQTLTQYTQMPASAGEVSVGPFQPRAEPCAVIHLEGKEPLELLLVVPADTSLRLTKKIFKELLSPQLPHDLAVELLNVTFGYFDPAARALGHPYRCSLPVMMNQATATQTCLRIPVQVGSDSVELAVFAAPVFAEKWTYSKLPA